MVYRDVSLYIEGAVHDARPFPIYTVSVDEKPGVQAIGLTAPDLPPVPGKAPSVGVLNSTLPSTFSVIGDPRLNEINGLRGFLC